MESTPLNDWVKRVYIPAATAAAERGGYDERFALWHYGALDGIAAISAQLEMQQVYTAEELVVPLMMAFERDMKRLGGLDD